MENLDQVAKNVKLGKIAKEIQESVEEFISYYDLSDEDSKIVLKRILKELFGSPKQDIPGAMDYDTARAFYHNQVMEFGKFKGQKLDEIDFSYLEWLDSQPDFRRDLTRFMSSEFVRNQHYMKG